MCEMETGATLALVGALIKRLSDKGILSQQDTQAIYGAATQMVSVAEASNHLLTRGDMLVILSEMAARLNPHVSAPEG